MMSFKLAAASTARAYGKQCLGCIRTNSAVMLEFGSDLTELDGNNCAVMTDHGILDIFLTHAQAEALHAELGKRLKEQE